ncbi:MAG: beta-galactosidase, partial [Salinivirgaceae bacterium]|nr:beta-galactosidase [Salinivirgaceae bacterium]
MKRLLLTICVAASTLIATAQSDLFILGGELSNSAATCVADIDDVMPRMKALGLNTVLVPAYWEMMEPSPGQFNFTLIDRTVEQARQLQLKVVFLWFGAWKNS